MNWFVIAVFGIVYLGMILGGIPGLALNRTGVALLGAIILFAFGEVGLEELPKAIDVATISLLFGLMVLSVQFQLAGSYSYIVTKIGAYDFPPKSLLAIIILVVGLLSALLINDIICLVTAPMIVELCARRKLNPVPFLLAVACASNIGSALTLVGNPQNILVGQYLNLSFSRYIFHSFVPVILSGAALWLIISHQYKHRWSMAIPSPAADALVFSRWQTLKGGLLAIGLLLIFLSGAWPRDLAALGVAGLLLCSRRMRTKEILGIVDWPLLVLFISLFVVNYAVNNSGFLSAIVKSATNAGINLTNPINLFLTTAVLSNVVSNVPAVMFLLPLAKHPIAGSILALSSTMAGNFMIVGSIANIIVVDQAARFGIHISWKQHAATGIPVTIISLALAALWLWAI